jgi:hypothetical protein
VIGHETARLLAENGAHLVHSAPSTGVRDWSDLRIAVAAGVWLASTRPGDMIDVVSDDQAFDAVGDVASSLGVMYRRLSYRSLRGLIADEVRQSAESDHEPRRRGRGGRGRRGGTARRHADTGPRHHTPAPHREPPPRPQPAIVAEDANAHTAPHDELIDVVRDLVQVAPGGVTLDQLANALRERGFRRTPGSPRLITRLKRIKELDVNRTGLIQLVDDQPVAHHGTAAPAQHAHVDEPLDIEPADDGEVAAESEAAPSEGTPEGGPRRRRRRRGGRRRRGRRGNGGNGGNGGGHPADGETDGEVIAAAAPASHEMM